MMTNVIFGSGIVGLLAKRFLGGDWTVVPFSRSRFYSFNPPLGDNFVTRDDEIDQPIREVTGDATPFFYRRCYSVGGQLVKDHDQALAERWVNKVYGADNVPGHAVPYLMKRMVMPIYAVRVNVLYQHLQNEYLSELKEEAAKGLPTEIGDHYFVRGGVKTEFDNAVTTIPLPVLLKLMGKEGRLPARDEHFVLVKSSKIDLEGCNQSMVVDNILDFHKVTALTPNTFMFSFTSEIPHPGAYLMPIIGSADILDGTKVANAIPAGPLPDLTFLEQAGMFSVGSYAQWDSCADVGSNLLRLIRYAARGFKPAQSKAI